MRDIVGQIPRVYTNLEVIRSICEGISSRVVEELARKLRMSKTTIRLYARSLERFGLLRKNGEGYELLKAGEEFLRLSRIKSLGEALLEAIVKFGDPSDISTVLRAYASGQLEMIKNGSSRTYRSFVSSWTTFLKRLGLISNGKLTRRGEELLLRNEFRRIVEELRKRPSLLARKALWCAGFEFRQEDLLVISLKHDIGLKLVLDELEKEGYKEIKLNLDCGRPDAVLEKNGIIYVLEHKSKTKLDKVDILQGYIYILNIKEAYNRDVKLMLSNGSREVRIYDVDEELLENIRELIWRTAEKLINNRFRPGRHCLHCGNIRCPHNKNKKLN